jgi:hypothetical protein
MRSWLCPPGVLLAGVSLVWAVPGCMGPQTTPARPARIEPGSYRTQQLNTSDYAAAFSAAQGAVMDHFQIASADPTTGVIQLAPSEYTRLGGARFRRLGQVVLWKTGSYIVAGVQIQIERYATPSIRAIQPTFSADDRPGTTPIQQDAGLTPQQQDYWMPERRDTALEAQILSQIAAAVDQANQSSASRPAAKPPAADQP